MRNYGTKLPSNSTRGLLSTEVKCPYNNLHKLINVNKALTKKEKKIGGQQPKMKKGAKGFTLIELLIVVAILGILAAVIIPNVATFMNTGRLNAARTEAENVKTAALAYYADFNTDTAVGWPNTSADLSARSYVTGALKGTYKFGTSGNITLSGTTYPANLFTWNEAGQTWIK
jgi:type IV pilus assembly protein PilA